jgi:hypothetical protein
LSPSGNHKNSKSTGTVVVDASGEIFGDVPNIAARAQAMAEPGAEPTDGLAKGNAGHSPSGLSRSH